MVTPGTHIQGFVSRLSVGLVVPPSKVQGHIQEVHPCQAHLYGDVKVVVLKHLYDGLPQLFCLSGGGASYSLGRLRGIKLHGNSEVSSLW